MKEVITIKSILKVHNGDFELWEEEKYESKYYHISIEGYIGFDKIKDFVDLYKLFLDELEEYLTSNNYTKTEKIKWETIYQTRAIEVCYESGCYWIFLDGYESTEVWDTYYYLEDVIKQLQQIEI